MALPPPPDLVGDRIHDYGLSGYLRPSSKSGRHRDTALSAERNQSAVYQRTKIREDDTRHRLAGTRLPNRRFPGRRPEIRESFHRGGRDRTATHRDPVGSASIPVIAPTLHASARKRYGESSAPLFLCPKVKNAHTAVRFCNIPQRSLFPFGSLARADTFSADLSHPDFEIIA